VVKELAENTTTESQRTLRSHREDKNRYWIFIDAGPIKTSIYLSENAALLEDESFGSQLFINHCVGVVRRRYGFIESISVV